MALGLILNKWKCCFSAKLFISLFFFISSIHLVVAQQSSPDSLNKVVPASAPAIQDTTKNIESKAISDPNSVKTPKRAEKLVAAFDTLEILIQEGDVFSKNLRVISNVEVPLSFKVDVGYPAEWRSLLNVKKVYKIAAHDTVYVPIRLLPLGKVRGNTKYMINAYLFDTIGAPITSAYVHASKPKFTKWSLNVGPFKKIYFKNESNESQFTVNVGNDGTESQDIYMSIINSRRNIILLDSNDKIIKKPQYSFTLKQFADTTFRYKVKLFSSARNMKRVDSEGYRPGFIKETQAYSLYVRTTETSLMGKNARQISQKLDFVKLPNERKISDYGMYSLPLTMDFNMSNLLSQQPTAYLFLNGAATLDNGGALIYNAQFIGSFGVLGGSVFAPPYFMLGYIDNRFSVMVGDVGGSAGIGVGGKGISGSYNINNRHRVGAFFVVNPGVFNRFTYYGTGANYSYIREKFRTTAGFIHIQNMIGPAKLTSNYLTSASNYSINQRHGLSLGFTLARNAQSGVEKYGYGANFGYSGSFIKSRLLTSATVGYYSKNYTFIDQKDRWMFNHNSSFLLSKIWSLRLSNLYNQYSAIPPVAVLTFYSQQVFNNFLTAGRAIDMNSSASGGFFYNVFIDNYYNYARHSRGVSFTYNYSTQENNLLFGFTSQFGYNRYVTIPNSPEQFFMNLFSIIKYRVYSLNVRYVNGNSNGVYSYSSSSFLFSQQIAISFNHQYQFRNPHFVLNNYLTYNLLPLIDKHSLGLTPELNFYSKNGWRIRLTGGYYRTSSRPGNYNPYKSFVSGSVAEDNQRVSSNSYLLMFGVRKEFGIPLPFIKRRFPSLNFTAFVDVNGNGKFDSDETKLENVVINVNGVEVLTNERGEAQLKNLPEGEFPIHAFSLEDLHGYFPNINEKIKIVALDSSKSKFKNPPQNILIPFVKGVKLIGRVYIDREKLSPDALSNLVDLSGIRITASNNGKSSSSLTDKEGSFVFYLPFGRYIISMDERILGDRLRVLQNDLEVQLDNGIENLFISFYLAENQRKINRKRFDANGNLIDEGAGSTTGGAQNGSTAASNTINGRNPNNGSNVSANPNAGKDLVAESNAAARKAPRPKNDVAKDAFLADKVDATTTKGLIYTIQLGALQKPLSPKAFDGLKNIMYERIDNDFVRITVGMISNEAEAKAERDNLLKVGFPGAFVSVYYYGKNITLNEANLLLKSGGGK